MDNGLPFPHLLSLRGHFVDQKGQEWTVEVPQAILEVHMHEKDPIDPLDPWGFTTYGQTSQYCLRLIKDAKTGGLLNFFKTESKLEV